MFKILDGLDIKKSKTSYYLLFIFLLSINYTLKLRQPSYSDSSKLYTNTIGGSAFIKQNTKNIFQSVISC